MTLAPPALQPATARWRRIGESLLAAWCLAAALLFAATTFCAIVNFGWRQPMFDQWREYETYLGLPFPQNVIQLDNGHRPILPNLVRVAEIHWFGANQVLQITIGALCAFASTFLLVACTWSERGLGRGRRALGVLAAVLGVLWLGNARRLLHGAEALHGYLPMLFALGAALMVHRLQEGRSAHALVVATVLCVLATFSFGFGLAAFCTVLLLLIVERRPWRELILPTGMLLVCFATYVLVLPGNDGVRNQLQFAPGETATMFCKWMASPWKSGWLDLASAPEPEPNFATTAQPLLAGSARYLQTDLGIGVDAFCLGAGIVGIAIFAAAILRIWRRGRGATRLEALAIGAAAYAMGSGVLTVASRLEALRQIPNQVYADRYLFLPTLFWCAIALLMLVQLPRLRSPLAWWPAALAVIALPIALLPTQNGNAIWGALVYRTAEAAAAAVRSGVYDAEHFTGEPLGTETHLREIALLRDRRLAMFADDAWQRVGTRWTGALADSSGTTITAHWADTVADPGSAIAAGHLEGWVREGLAKLRRYRQLMILAPDGAIAGLAEFSQVSPFASALQLRFLPKRAFDGYVHAFDPQQEYLLVAADFASNKAVTLARITPGPQTAAPGDASAASQGMR